MPSFFFTFKSAFKSKTEIQDLSTSEIRKKIFVKRIRLDNFFSPSYVELKYLVTTDSDRSHFCKSRFLGWVSEEFVIIGLTYHVFHTWSACVSLFRIAFTILSISVVVSQSLSSSSEIHQLGNYIDHDHTVPLIPYR